MIDYRPHCAVCGRKVDELVAWIDEQTGDRVFEVRCHGAKEQMRIQALLLQRGLDIPKVTPGVAFAARQIAR